MGMYTHCRGWIYLRGIDYTKKIFEEIHEKARDISPRSSCCMSCTSFNRGFNWCNYIFIGGEIKNYDDDWNTYLKFLFENFEIDDYSIELKYGEYDGWKKFAYAVTDEQEKEE